MPNVRDAVAAVAGQVFATAGLDSSTIRDVATAGGWSTTMVTHYFSSKNELLAHTLALSVSEMTARIEAAQGQGVDELPAIIELILPLDEERTQRWQLWLAFWGAAIGSDDLAAIQRSRQEGLVQMLGSALQRRHEAMDPAIALAEARRIVALLDGVSVQAVFAPDQWPADAQHAYFADILAD